MNILVLHGPNLNLLGQREAQHYGQDTLETIDTMLGELAQSLNCNVECKQSNLEGELVEWIQGAVDGYDGILINPAAYTHTSVAIRDALLVAKLPVVEVHLSNPEAREAFRHTSLIGDIVVGRVSGFQKNSYRLGLLGLIDAVQESHNSN